MATPLRWNTPGLTWSKPGVVWNSMEPPSKRMKKIKAIINFTGYTNAELAPVAQTIYDGMTANAATFTAPPVTMVALAALIATYEQKLAAKASRDSQAVISFNVARHEMEGALSDLGGYVNFVAQGDETIVGLSGFPSYGGSSAVAHAIPAAPANLRVTHGPLSGSVVLRYKPDRQHSMNEVQKNPGDPNSEAGWADVGMFGSGKAVADKLAVGGTVWFRVRTRLSNNTWGPWSDPAKITVL